MEAKLEISATCAEGMIKMRTIEEIEAEIYKVEKAEIAAAKKKDRCKKRLKELDLELKKAEEANK